MKTKLFHGRAMELPHVLLLSMFFGGSHAQLRQTYCSNFNTAQGYQAFYDQYQTNGLCHDRCQADYAFAVVKGNNCWCSNYVPADQQSVGDCNLQCPGFGYENCGSNDDNLYGYVALSKEPSGTLGASSPTSTRAQQSSSPTPTALTTKTSSSVISTSSPTSTWSPTPVTSVQVITVSGAAVTQTVTTTPTVPPSANLGAVDKGLGTGQIVGIVIAVLIAVAALVVGLLVFFLWWRPKKQRALQDRVEQTEGQPGPPHRTTSTLSRTGLLSEKYGPAVPAPAITRTSTHDLGDVSPVSEKRNSKLPYVDQRLNPKALGAHDNSSHMSVSTIHDERDYHRNLVVRNPDDPVHMARTIDDKW